VSRADRVADHVTLDDAKRVRRRHEPAPAPSRIFLDDPTQARAPLLGFALGEERSDRLAGRAERRVGGIDENLGHDGDDVASDVFLAELVQQVLLEDVTQAAFRHCHEHVERHRRRFLFRAFLLQQQRPHLRTVPVRDDEVVLLLDEGHQQPRDLRGIALVLFDRALLTFLHEGVAAHGDQHDRFSSALPHRVLLQRTAAARRVKLTRDPPAPAIERSSQMGQDAADRGRFQPAAGLRGESPCHAKPPPPEPRSRVRPGPSSARTSISIFSGRC
jgi:hypothetical protein